jgi:uncharacterized membrane protein
MNLQHFYRHCFLVIAICFSVTTATNAQESGGSPLDDEGHLIDYARDIAPIFQSRCLECHGPEDAKNDFRVDDRDSLMDYIEAEDVESSSLFVDYLTTDDEDMLMPPKSHGGPLGPKELALVQVWIQEGAQVPEDYQMSGAAVADRPAEKPPQGPRTIAGRVWGALGFLHPATVHFPIALFLLGGGFVVVGWKWPSVGYQIPLACLLLGTVTAIASTAMGWSFAVEQGYGDNWDLLDWDREIDTHRWSGLIVTIVASVFSIVALVAIWNDSEKLTKFWKIGLLICAGMVGAVGHQGGELSYGEDFYPKALRILTGADETPEAAPITEPVPAAESVSTTKPETADEPQSEPAT